MSNHVVAIDEAWYTCSSNAGAVWTSCHLAEISTKQPMQVQAIGRHLICKMQCIFESVIEFVTKNTGQSLRSPMRTTGPSLISGQSKFPFATETLLEPSHANAHSFGSDMNQKTHVILEITRKKGVYS